MSRLEEYRRDNESKEKFLDIVYYNLTKDSLVDQNVMIINMFTENDYLDMEEIFSNTKINKIIEAEIPKKSDDSMKNIVKGLKHKSKMESTHDEIQKSISEKIYSQLLIGDYDLLPFYFKDMDGLNFQGDIYTSIDYVILVDDGFKINNKDYGFVRNELINLVNTNNIPLMVIEKSNTKHSSMTFYKELGISTVDNVDTKLGQIAMFMVLNGKEGHFGEKVTADSLIPEDILYFDIN
jgi:hypothetical protein